MRLQLVSFLLAFSAFKIVKAEPKCHTVEMGACVDILVNYISSFPRRTLIKTESEMDGLCKAIKSATACCDDFQQRCMTPIQRELDRVMMEGFRDYQAKYCAPNSELQKRYLRNAECLNEVLQSNEMDIAINRGVVLLERLEHPGLMEILTYSCCGWNAVFGTAEQLVEDSCGPEAATAINELLEAALSNLPSVICGGYDEDSDQCQAVLPPEGAKPTGKQNPFVNGFRYFFAGHVE